MPASTSTLPSGPVQDADVSAGPFKNAELFRSLCVTMETPGALLEQGHEASRLRKRLAGR